MENLFSKFEKVKVTSVSKIHADDKLFCENEQQKANESLKQIEGWKDFFEQKAKEDTNPQFTIEGHNHKYISVKREGYRQYEFTPLYDLMHIEKMIQNLKHKFVRQIENYFEKKYNLDLDFDLEKFDKKELRYTELVDDLIISIGGFSLVEAGEDKLKEDFKSTIYWQHNFEIKNDTLNLKDYVYYDSNSKGLTINYRDTRQEKFRKAISFFENGSLDSIATEIEFKTYSSVIDVDNAYQLSNFSKIKSVKYFKNGKISIKFASKQLVEEFVQMFRLNTIKEK